MRLILNDMSAVPSSAVGGAGGAGVVVVVGPGVVVVGPGVQV